MNKVVIHLQVKNKWDHLRSQWKQLFDHESGFGYDLDTRKIDASDEWWERNFKASLLLRMLTTSIFYN